MTEQTSEPSGGSIPSGSTSGPSPEARPQPAAEPQVEARPATFEERMNGFGREANAAGERFGRRGERAANRWSRDPGVVHVADTATRIWGLIVLGVGLWFFADVTLGYDMPSVAWRDLWPIALIGLGLLVVARGITRRRT